MKKVFLTAIMAAAFAFGMTACGGNAEETNNDSMAQETECCEHHEGCCEHENDTCAHDCAACPNQGTENCCKAGEAEHQCQGNHEGCQHQCQGNHEGGCCEHK